MDRNNLKQVKLVFESFENTNVDVFFTENSYYSNKPDDIILLKPNQEKSTTYFHKDNIYTFTFDSPAFITSAKIEGALLSCNRLFSSCENMISLDVSKLDTSKVTDMSYMFDYCFRLTYLDLSNFDTSNVTNMRSMFSTC